ncbi:MAG: hypothetical protein AB7F09_08195 [Parvibaculaceae bacterium]
MPEQLNPARVVAFTVPPRWLKRVFRAQKKLITLEAARPKKGLMQTEIEPLARAPFFHHISVSGTTEFHDYETFGDDEHGIFGFRQETTLSTSDIGATFLTWRKGFGGEERVEIDIDGSLRADGVLAANINLRFYEGATEGTTELEDSRAIQAIVPQGQTSNFDIHLRNDEDDWATIRGSIGNQRL